MPYEPIPYAPDEVYSSRDYTRQQMALLQQQADREGAYAQRRGALMADRWKGLGGLATETLASLVQSRDLREAKAEAQRRYDVQQARLVAEDARVAEADRVAAANLLDQLQQRRATQIREDVGVAGTLTDEQAAAMEAARPGSTEAFTSRARTSPTLASVNRPPSQMGDLPFRSVRFGDEAPVPALDDVSGNVRNIERQAPPSTSFGPALVAGTSETPATSGTRMRMTGAQGKALEKDVAREAAIQALVVDGRLGQDQADLLKQNPDLPAQAWATVFPAEVKTSQTLPSTYEAAAVRADLAGRPEDAAYFRRLDLAQRAAGRAPSTTDDASANVKQMVTGMIDGTVPPILPGRASPLYVQIVAEANRRGFNLTSASQDWSATSRTLASMAGPQQLRVRQSIGALPGLLDEVEGLAKQWKAGAFPPLNAAQLALAKNGAMGEKAARIAVALDAQIADVVADLGNVYMGGNSPTDHALDLASKSLSADWNEKVLLSMIDLARRNVRTRQNSMANVGVAGASANNLYAPPVVSAAPDTSQWFTSPNGVRYRPKTTP